MEDCAIISWPRPDRPVMVLSIIYHFVSDYEKRLYIQTHNSRKAHVCNIAALELIIHGTRSAIDCSQAEKSVIINERLGSIDFDLFGLFLSHSFAGNYLH